jgi:hypothetical protein
MGENYKLAGFNTLKDFLKAMEESESKQLDAFVQFLKSTGADKYLQAKEWTNFAISYNGPKQNGYDEKIKQRYIKLAGK